VVAFATYVDVDEQSAKLNHSVISGHNFTNAEAQKHGHCSTSGMAEITGVDNDGVD